MNTLGQKYSNYNSKPHQQGSQVSRSTKQSNMIIGKTVTKWIFG